MFSAPFDMERTLVKAFITADTLKLSEITGKNTKIEIEGNQYTIEEALHIISDAKVQYFTIDLLKVEYDTEENRYIHYTTEMTGGKLREDFKSAKYSITTKWTLNSGNYIVKSIQVSRVED